ncbi:MAG: response regulator [Clostridiales Family XIII bacterium]|jgi:signal transduction histidine kinase/CheY-like chemotaxis protein|nr:response regulator [Clostridiales Family XIII bacterium]
MIQKSKNLVYKYILSEEMGLDARILNLVCLFGLMAAICATIARIIEQVPFITILVMIVMAVLIIALMVFANKYNLHRIGTILILIGLNHILFPLVFFTNGGIDSGMTAYFALEAILVFLLLRGKTRVVLLCTTVAVIIVCYYISIRFPELVTPLNMFQRYVDHLQSLLVTGFFVGFVIVFQNKIYTFEKQKAEISGAEIAKQDELLQVINNVSSILLTSDIKLFEKMLWDGMDVLGRGADADRLYIWKNRAEGEALCYTLSYTWEKNVSLAELQSEHTTFSYADTIPDWEDTLSKGRCVNGPLRRLSPAAQDWLRPYGIRSMLVTPIHLNNRFWGFVSFADCTGERIFTDDEIDILRSGGLLMANAILRDEMTKNLVQAREDALSSARAKSDFLANMSHEIRTPLNAVIGMTSIGKTAEGIEKKDYCFEKIDDASTHLLGVINDILDMSKIEANKLELSPADFDFEEMLQRVVNVIMFRVDERHQKLAVRIGKSVPPALVGDDQRLAQVITNLIGNAVKFTPENGSIALDAELLHEEAGLCTLEIAVSDTGIGINEEQKSRLFTSFEQAESNTTRKFGGTGLGLAISKRIVEMMGGEISVASELGKGSVFTFTVQMRRGAQQRRSAGRHGVYDHIRLLAVDDAPDVLRYFADVAKRFNIACDTAADGESALARIDEAGLYNLYFLDLEMPHGMNGIELARSIKERDAEHAIVIMSYAADWDAIKDVAAGDGIDGFIPKPLFPSSIMDCINESLGIRQLTADVSKTEEADDFAGRRVILAEDVDINREIVLALLEPTKLVIDCAENGVEAVRLFRENPDAYDLIFMDLQMPEMDGYEAAGLIRAMDFPQAKEIPIVAMTANVFREDIEKCLAAGMNGHVGKPLNFDEVLAELRKYLPKEALA